MVKVEVLVLHRPLPGIVDSKLRMHKKIPISHGGRHKVSEHILNSAIHALCLTISLRVKCCWHVPWDAQAIRERLIVLASKLRASVRNGFQGKTMIAEHMLNEQVSPSLCSAFCCSGDNVYILGQSVNKDKNSIIACLGLRKTCDKVSRDTVPRTMWNVQRLQQTRWLDR